MYCGLVGNTAKNTVGANLNVDIVGYQYIHPTKDGRNLNCAIFFNDGISQVTLHTTESGRKLCTLEHLAVKV